MVTSVRPLEISAPVETDFSQNAGVDDPGCSPSAGHGYFNAVLLEGVVVQSEVRIRSLAFLPFPTLAILA